MAPGGDVGEPTGSGLGVGLGESIKVNKSGAVSWCGSTTMDPVGETSHRSSMRLSLKKSRPLSERSTKLAGQALVEMEY